MQKFFMAQRCWLKWMFLFLSAVILGMTLSHALNRSPSSYYSDVASNPPSTSDHQNLTPSLSTPNAALLQVQTKYDRSLAHYAIVSRSDGSFRQMFVDRDSISSIQPGEPLPEGTLIVMESWRSNNLGTVFVKQKQNGEWQYGSFSPDRPDYEMRFSGSCHSCHAPFPQTDFTLTKPLLEAAVQTRQVQTAFCDRPGRTPCDPESYLPNAMQ